MATFSKKMCSHRFVKQNMYKVRIFIGCLLTGILMACQGMEEPVSASAMALKVSLCFEAKLKPHEATCMRYVIRAYPIADGVRCDTPVQEEVFTKKPTQGYDYEVILELIPGEYEVMVWADLMDGDIPYYHTDDFGEITRRGKHQGNNDLIEAYRGCGKVTMKGYGKGSTLAVTMESPLAKFELVAEDLAEFMAKETQRRKGQSPVVGLKDYRVVFQYVGYMPNAFSIYTDRPVDSSTGVTFTSSLKELNPTEASLGFDYVFVNDKESAVTVRVAIYDAEGTCLSTSRSIKVPLKRNQHTVLRGTYLTQEASDGISIDNNYEGDFNLVIP